MKKFNLLSGIPFFRAMVHFIKPTIHILVLFSYLISFVLPVNGTALAAPHNDDLGGAVIPAQPTQIEPIIGDQKTQLTTETAPLSSDFGDIVSDHSHGKGPIIDHAINGVPLELICKPDARGISHNQLLNLVVGDRGLILNNSTEKKSPSQLGGQIIGNHLLQGQNARIIIQEVTGNNTSQIRGYIEVHGQAAELVIVNPNGIDVNGAGFINVPKATLSTGQLQAISDGRPIQLKVDGGEITIQGKGLNLSGVSQFDLVTRKVNLDGAIGNTDDKTDVSIRAGKQRYDYASRTSHEHGVPEVNAEPEPVYAIDSSALGGMYAGKIALISTEKGVGVRAPENMAARMSDITVLANGDVVLKNAEAQGKIDVKSKGGSVTLAEGKTVLSQTGIDVTAHKKVTVSENARLQSNGTVTVKGREFENHGKLASGIKTAIAVGPSLVNHGAILSEGEVNLSAAEIDNFGQINGEETVQIQGRKRLTNHAGSEALIRSGGVVDLRSAHLINESNIKAGGDLRVSGSGRRSLVLENQADGVMQTMGLLRIEGKSLLNHGLLFSRDQMAVMLDENMTNNGWIVSHNGMRIGLNGDFLNSYRDDHIGGEIQVTGPLTIEGKAPDTKAKSIVNSSGLIETFGPEGHMLFRGGLVENKMKRHEVRTEEVSTGIVDDGKWRRKKRTTVSTESVAQSDLPGQIYSSGSIEIDADETANIRSQIRAKGNITVNGKTVVNRNEILKRYTQIETWYKKKRRSGGLLNKIAKLVQSLGSPLLLPKANDGPKKFQYILHPPVYEAIDTHTFASSVFAEGGLILGKGLNVQNIEGAGSVKGKVPYIPSGRETTPEISDSAADYAVFLDHSPLYETHLGAGHDYLFETRKEFADPRYVMGSDYFFFRVGPFAGQPFAAKRMGDAFVETRFIKRQMAHYKHFNPEIDPIEHLKQLYDNAALETEDLELYPGMKMTADLINRLKRDIIWMEPETINGEEVLVPRLYVSKLSNPSLPPVRNGLFGKDVILDVAALHNEGVIRATEVLDVKVAGDLTQVGGTLDGQNTAVVVEGTLSNQSSVVSGDVTRIKAQNLLNETLVAHNQVDASSTGSAQATGQMIARTGDLTVEATNELVSRGGAFEAGKKLELRSGAKMDLGSAVVQSHAEAHGKDYKYTHDQIENVKTNLKSGSGHEMLVVSGGDQTHKGLNAESGGDQRFISGGELTSEAVHDVDEMTGSSKGKGLFRSKINRSEAHSKESVNRNDYKATGKITMFAEGDVSLKAVEMTAPESITLESKTGKVSLLADVSKQFDQNTKNRSNIGWQSMKDFGSTQSTQVVSHMNTSALITKGAEPTKVDVRAPHKGANLAETIAAGAENPATAYVAALAEDPLTEFNIVNDYHKSWKHHKSGMTPEFTIAVAAAVGLVTGGFGAPAAAGAGAGAGAGAAAAAGGTAAAASTAAATTSAVTFSSIGTAAATAVGKAALTSTVISGINNKGDLGLVAKDLTSKDQLNSFVMTALTAGATHGIGGALEIPASTTSVGARVQNVALQRSVNVVVSTTIGGESVSDSVKANAIGGAVDFGAGLASQKIGEMYHGDAEEVVLSQESESKQTPHIDYVTHKLAHGIVGGVAGGILGGSKGAAAGATGAIVSEMTIEALGQNIAEESLQEAQFKADQEGRPFSRSEYQHILSEKIEMLQNLSQLSSAGVSLLAGQDVGTSVQTAHYAVENNGVQGLLALAAAALIAYEVGKAYKEGGAEAAVKALILEGVIMVVGGTVFKVAGKTYMSAALAFEAACVEYPALQKVATSLSSKTIEPGKVLLNKVHTRAVAVVARSVESEAGQKAIRQVAGLQEAVEGSTIVRYGRSALESITEGLQKVGLIKAEQGAAHQVEKEVAESIDLRVKPKVKRGKDGKVKGVERTQIHHIVHQSFRNDPFLLRIGYDINQRANKMILPTVEGASLFTAKRSIHQGPHLEEVKQIIEEAIRGVERKSMLRGWDNQRSIEAVNKALASHRALLKSGKIPLNKHFQPQAQDTIDEWAMKRLLNNK